ncbi:hypothetical protein KRM28CT15_60890 [Krasilnikovia sp. M28-CT-15]
MNKLGALRPRPDDPLLSYLIMQHPTTNTSQCGRRADDPYDLSGTLFEQVPLDTVVTLKGDCAYEVRLRVARGNDAASYTVWIKNSGYKPFDISHPDFSATLYIENGRSLVPEGTGTGPRSVIDPGSEVTLTLKFKIPANAKPSGISLSLFHRGQFDVGASWNPRWTLKPGGGVSVASE